HRLAGRNGAYREIEDQAISVAGYSEFTGLGRAKPETCALRREMAEEHVRRTNRGMTTQVHFHGRGKPADFVVAITRHDKGGFRQIVFCRDRLQKPVWEPFFQDANASRVAAKR